MGHAQITSTHALLRLLTSRYLGRQFPARGAGVAFRFLGRHPAAQCIALHPAGAGSQEQG